MVDVKESISLATKIKNEEMSSRDLERILDSLQTTKTPRKTKEISRQYKIVSNDEVIGHIKDWDSGKVVLEVTIVDAGKRQQLLEELQLRFGISA